MQNIFRVGFVALLLAVLSACASPAPAIPATQAAEQPQVNGPSSPKPEMAQPAWTAKVSAAVNTSPIMSGDLVIVPTADGVIHAIHAQNGETAWVYAELKVWDASVNADKEKVCAGAEGSQVLCLDAKTGSLLWTASLDLEVQSRVALTQDRVIAPTTRAGSGLETDFHGQTALVAFDAKSGQVVWQSLTENYILRRPVIQDGAVITGGAFQPVDKPDGEVATRLYAFDLDDGSLLWEYQSNDGLMRWVETGEEAVFFSAATEIVYALSLDEGKLLWKTSPGYWMQFPVVQNGRIFFGSGDEIFHAFNASTGTEDWSHEINLSSLNQIGRPVIRENALWFHAVTGEIYAVDIETGERLAYLNTGHSARVGGTMFESLYIFGDPDGNVCAYDIE